MTAWMFCFTLEETDLFVTLWEGQSCLWDPADVGYENQGVHGTALASIAETFGRG